MKYDGKGKWIRSRLNLPTTLKSADLARIEAGIKANAFFSAGVAQEHVLMKLREVSDAYSMGKLDLATARLKLKDWLVANGAGRKEEPGSQADSVLSNLWTTSRLNLILRQNARMAMAVGEYEAGMSNRDMFPYWRYIASTSTSPRASHRAYAGKVYRKDDPIWKRIFPPWEFNCKCSVEEVAADEVETGDVEKPLEDEDRLPPLPASGYDFDVTEGGGKLDPECIDDVVLRCNIVQELQGRFGCTTETDAQGHTVLKVHDEAARKAKRIVPKSPYYDKAQRMLKRRYMDTVSKEEREDIKEYVESFASKNEPTTNDYMKLRMQRRTDRRMQPEATKKVCEAYLALDEGERHSLDAYTSRDPYRLNWAARNEVELDSVQQREQDRLIKVLNKLPTYSGTVYRGMWLDDKTWQKFQYDFSKGKTPLTGFLSTSWDKGMAEQYARSNEPDAKGVAVVFVIDKCTKGHFLGPISSTPADEEVLYATGQQFKCTGIVNENGYIYVHLAEA